MIFFLPHKIQIITYIGIIPQCGIICQPLCGIIINKYQMDKKEFLKVRRYLEKTQNELAKLICVSPKAIQSFEQGWRNIPPHVERELLLLLSLKKPVDGSEQPCWEIKKCPEEWRDICIIWELQAKRFCWFLSGTFCQGKAHQNWEEKIKLCRECEVYQSIFSLL
jgi:DNA-binding XRE family transcriptional regulator